MPITSIGPRKIRKLKMKKTGSWMARTASVPADLPIPLKKFETASPMLSLLRSAIPPKISKKRVP